VNTGPSFPPPMTNVPPSPTSPPTASAPPAPPAGTSTPDAARSRRGPMLVGAAVVAVVALVAVGVLVFVGREAQASYSLERAVEQALEATDALATIEIDVPGVGAASLDVRADGDTERSAVSMLLDGGLTGDLLGVPDVVANPDGPLSLVLDHASDELYLDLSSVEVPGVPDGWLRLDVGAVAGFLGVDLDDVDALENATADADGTVWPMQLAAAIAGAGTAESTGELEVDGETVHRYRVTVPLEDLTAAELGDALDTLGSLVPGEIDLPESITYDVDVAADDQLRRIAASLELAGVAVTASMEVEAREDVVVDLPDPDDVIDIAGLLAGIVEQALADGREALGDAGGALGDLFGGTHHLLSALRE
jgi:hypothetical protein